MPIRKSSRFYNSDYMSRRMDKRLQEIEDQIQDIYSEAILNTNRRLNAYLSEFADYEEELQDKLKRGEITQEMYNQAMSDAILQTTQYQGVIQNLADSLVDSDVMAMAIVNGELPYVVAESYNFVQSLGFAAADEAGISVGTFQIYNARSVQAILLNNPNLLPHVNEDEDRRWNITQINREITQAIVSGEPVQSLAGRLQRVANMDNNAAIRNARTSMTAAENLGRTEAARFIRSQGVPIDEVWSATHDNRTRDTHILLDGTKKDANGYYGVGIIDTPLRFPGDPLGDPGEIYNCRCRENIVLQGIDHSQDGELYAQFMQENYPSDWSQLRDRIPTQDWLDQRRREAQERVDRRREERRSQ